MTGALLARRHPRHRRPLAAREVGRGPAHLSRRRHGGLPEPLHHHRPGQPVGALQHGARGRAARGLDRATASPICASTGSRASRRTLAAEDAWVGHVNDVANLTVYPSCNSWYLGANVPGQAARVHAVHRVPDLRGEVQRGRGEGLRGLRATPDRRYHGQLALVLGDGHEHDARARRGELLRPLARGRRPRRRAAASPRRTRARRRRSAARGSGGTTRERAPRRAGAAPGPSRRPRRSARASSPAGRRTSAIAASAAARSSPPRTTRSVTAKNVLAGLSMNVSSSRRIASPAGVSVRRMISAAAAASRYQNPVTTSNAGRPNSSSRR